MLITIDIPEVRYPEVPVWRDMRMQQIAGRVEEMTIADNVMAQVEIQMARAIRDKKRKKSKNSKRDVK